MRSGPFRSVAALLTLACLAQGPVPAADEPAPPAKPSDAQINFQEITPEQERAIERGLDFLAKSQNPANGGWGTGGQEGAHMVATTALAGLAFLAHGDTPTQGKYAPQVRKAIDFLVEQSDPSGLIHYKGGGGHSPMHEHGYAMLFLGEVYGMSDSPKTNQQIREVLRKAVDLTSRAQSGMGGWLYTPDSRSHEGSVTVTQVEGLRAARNAGVQVDKKVISKAIDFIKISQNPDGSIMYAPGSGGGHGSLALTTAGIAVMYNAGEFNDKTNEIIRKSLGFFELNLKQGGGRLAGGGHEFYTHLYASQAAFLAGPRYWNQYFPSARKYLLETQGKDGAWQTGGVGPCFNTAIACFILQIPYRYLPILQK